MDLTQRISKLSPQQRKMLALKLEQRNINIDILKLPITRENRTHDRQRFPLSFQQEGLWLIHQLNPNNSAYNIIKAAALEGTLNKHALEQSINEIIQRHDILRTIFISDKQAPVQVIINELSLPLQINDLKDFSKEKQEQEIRQITRDESQYVFDLTTGPLLRTKLFVLSENKHMFLMVIHHIISDGTSIQVFIRELVQLYEAFSQGKPPHLPEQTIHYVDYACWQRQWWGLIKKQEEFWLEQFKGEIPVLNLPLDYPRPTIQNFEGSTLVFHLSAKETKALKEMALKEKTTLYVVLLTIYNILLSKLSGSEDIIVGTPVAGRQHPGVQKLMGMFVNTLALRNYPHQNKTGQDFLEQVRERTLKAFENQEYQYENLLARVKVTRDNSRSPLFDVMFLLGNVDLAKINTRGLVFKIYNDENKTAKFDLTLRAWEQGDRLHFSFEYCTKLFKPATIRRMSNYFKRIVTSVIENPDSKIKDIEIISPQKKREILAQFNRDLKDTFDMDTLQHKLFQAPGKHPDQVAIEYGAVQVTYSQLDKRSTLISCRILHHGIERGSFIGIYQDDPIDIISFMVGILKAACVFVPLDTVIPVKRIRQMTRLTHLRLIFTTAVHKEQLTSYWKDMPQNIELIEIGSTFYKQCQLLPAAHEVDYKGDDPIYIYFTSGSTGAPRAILGKNISLLQFINWEMETFGITTGVRVSQLTSVGFDAFLRNVFIPLCAGGVVCIPTSQELVMDSEALIDWIDRSRIRLIHCVPAVFRLFNPETLTPQHFKNLKYVFTAGDIIYPHELERWYRRFDHRVQLVNGYGTTETTMFKTYYLIQKSDTRRDRIPVGQPIRGTSVIILDENLQVCDQGIVGEIYIRTPYSTWGYCNDPQLNKEKLIPNPFSHDPSDLVFRTGDLARLLEDGSIEFLARKDAQVKIRGIRVELGEIESQLLKHSQIKGCVIVARSGEKKENYLCAYIVAARGQSVPGLREYLKSYLPGYMIPAYFVFIDRIPLTPNLKVDLTALPVPELKAADNDTPPGTPMEKKLASIWSEVLKARKEVIAVDSNFFEMGGHSLLAANMAARVHKEFHVKLPLAEIFKTPTIRGLSQYIQEAGQDKYTSIKPVEKKEYYQLSSAQKRLFILQQMDDQHTAYNMPQLIPLDESPGFERLETAFRKLIRRHESLRTSFEIVNDQPIQKTHQPNEIEFAIEYYDLTTEGEERKRGSWEAEKIGIEVRPFDLSRAPLIRVGLIKIEPLKHILMIDMHHIISDAISMRLMRKDFIALYENRELHELRIRYKDYAEWQNRGQQKKAIKTQEEYWLKEFNDGAAMLNLPFDYPRPAVQSFVGDRINFEIGKERQEALKKISKSRDATLFMVLLAAYNVLLAKLTGQEDIIIGTPTAGRQHADLEHIIGMFVNTLALRNYPAAYQSFERFLEEMKQRTLEAFDHQDYPFEDLVEKISLQRDTSRNPVFDVMFSLHNPEDRPGNTAGIEVSARYDVYGIRKGISKFDMTFTGIESNDQLTFIVEYCTKLFKKETITRYIGYFNQILSFISGCPDILLSQIDIIPAEEKRQLLYDFNDTAGRYPEDKTILRLFEEQVERTPDNIALVGPHEVHELYALYEKGTRGLAPLYMTYKELNKQVNQQAHLLQEKGVQPDTIVGIIVERSLDMIIGILAILKAGGAYLPVDPQYPAERINFMLADSAAKILLSEVSEVSKVSEGIESIFIDKAIDDFTTQPTQPTQHTHLTQPTQLCCVIYTSGSTGKPKGVLVTHGNLTTYIFAFFREFNIHSTDTVVQLASYSFDAFVEEVFPILLKGGKLIIPPKYEMMDIDLLYPLILKHHVNIIDCTPLLLNEFNQRYTANLENQSLEHTHSYTFISGGDVLKKEYVDNLLRVGKVYNTYGPTESTICVTYFNYRDINRDLYSSDIPIGKPISNYKAYILDKYNKLVPVGTAGELCVSGCGVTRGYLNNPELTAEKFILAHNSWLTADRKAIKGAVKFPMSYQLSAVNCIYKTGDLARWLGDGNIEFLGRIDHQVKIRGFRIELGEIESQLLKHPQIKEAVVLHKQDETGDKYLCAYIVSDSRGVAGELKHYLAHFMPDYMIPAVVVQIEKIPLTPNGKIDRKALAKAETGQTRENYTAPRDEIERQLVEIWSEVLGRDVRHPLIGIDDNFFELGGHSLKATVLVSKIHKKINVKLPLAELFTAPFIRQLSAIITKAAQNQYAAIEPVEKKDHYALSSAQMRLYILQQMDLNSTAYNIPQAVVLEGTIDKIYLQDTLNQLIRRHESLRTSFPIVAEEPVQRVHGKVELEIEYHRAKRKAQSAERKEECYAPCAMRCASTIKNFIRPFDLSRPPLLRAGLLHTPAYGYPSQEGNTKDKYILIVDMHHIISDEVSHDIFINDLLALYAGHQLPKLRLQYKDFSQWQNNRIQSGTIKKQAEYWLKTFEGEIPLLKMPTDYERPDVLHFQGRTIALEIGTTLYTQIKTLVSETKNTLNIFLLAAYNVLLSKYTGQQAILVGNVTAGRRHADLQNIIGFFVNMLTIKNHPEEEQTFEDFLDEVKKTSINAYENQDYPFEELVSQLDIERKSGRHPLIDTVFVLQNQEDKNKWEGLRAVGDSGLNLKPYEMEHQVAHFDLMLHATAMSDSVSMIFEYSTALFKQTTIEELSKCYMDVLEQVVKNKKIKLKEITSSHEIMTESSDVLHDRELSFEF